MLPRLALELRRSAGAFAIDSLFRGMAAAGRLHPLARPARHGVEVVHDVAYRASGRADHRLDVYRPIASAPPWPIVLYVHGGGFRILSKDTHWIMGLAYARRGYLVFNVNYRLAPTHPFPAAIEDACDAYSWVVENGASFGGDPSRVIVAGESAGANLAATLGLVTSYERPEPFAKRAFDLGVQPAAVVAACGILQVSDPTRFHRRKPISVFLRDRIEEVSKAYLGGADATLPGGLELADPLCVLERGEKPTRPLPPFFAPVGTGDPLLDDTRRLKVALDKLGVPCDDQYYKGEPHAFHAVVVREVARRCWGDTFAFLDKYVPAPAAAKKP